MSLEKINESAGIIVFLALIAIAVGLFINSGFLASKFEYIEKEAYDFSYGVEGVIKKETSQYEPIFKRNLITAVVVFILGPSMYMLFEKLGLDENLGVYIFLALIGLAASLLAYSSIRYSSYKDIIKFRDPKIQKKEGRLGKASGILWILTIGIYLAYSLKTGNWDKSWICLLYTSPSPRD